MIPRFISGLSLGRILAIPTYSIVASNDINALYLPQVLLSVDDEKGGFGGVIVLCNKALVPQSLGLIRGHLPHQEDGGFNVNTLKKWVTASEVLW
jgi:hypothetical protein